MERSATPKVSQIQQEQQERSGASNHSGGATGSKDSNQDSSNSSNSNNNSGLLGWMKSALQMPTPTMGINHSGERMRKSSNSNHNPIPLSPTGLTRSSSSDSNDFPPRNIQDSINDPTHSNRSSISIESNNTSGEESGAEELYHPFKPRDQLNPAAAINPNSNVKTPLMVVKPTARRDITANLNDSDDLPEKPILLDSPSTKEKYLEEDLNRRSLVLDESLTGQCVVDHTLSSKPPSVILTPPEDQSNFTSFSSRLDQDYEYDDDHESIQGDGSRELDGVEYLEGEGPSREQVAIGSSAAFQREKFNRANTSSSSSRKRRGNSKSEGGSEFGDDTLESARQEWDESRSKTPLASAAAWARKQQNDPNQPPLPELVTALRADADARKASLSERTPVVGSSGKAFPDSNHQPEKPTRKKSSAGRRAATEGGGGSTTTTTAEVGDTSNVPLSIPAPQRPAKKGFFSRRDRSSSEASFSNDSSILDAEDGMEELSATDSISSSSNKGSSNRASGSFWGFGKRNSGIKPPTPSRTPRPGDVSVANQHRESSSESEASESEASEDESERRREEKSKKGRTGSEGSFNEALRDFKDHRSSKGSGPTIRHLVKTRYKGKSSKDRNFGRLFLVQELPLGKNLFGEDEATISRRSSMISQTGSGNGFDQGHGGRTSMESNTSSSIDGNGRKSGEGLPQRRRSMHHTDSSMSLNSDISSSSTVASNLSSAASSNGTGTTNNGKSKKKATWAMKFSLDGMYLAVAGQDSVVRVFQVLNTPQARKNEMDLQNLNADGLNPLGIGGNGNGKGGSNPSLASKDTGSSNGGSIGKNSKSKRNSGFGPPPAEGIAPVFGSTPIREFRGHLSDVLDLSWSKNNFLLSSSMDKTAKLWHLSRNECLCTFGHLDFVTSACFHPRDDRFFISGSLDGKLRLWNIPNKTVQASTEVPGLITACAFTQSGETACVGTFAGAALFYETERLQYTTSIAVRSSSGKNARGRKITGIEAVPSAVKGQERVLITSNDSRIRVYDLRDKSHVKYKASGAYQNRTSQIRASSSQDGQFIIAGSEDASIYIWDAIKEGPNSNSSSSKKKKNKSESQSSKNEAGSGGGGYESWTAASTTVTCALMAPLKSHAYLTASEDPVQMKAEMLEAGTVSSNTTNALSALSLASALSAAMPAPLRPGGPTTAPSPAFDARFNRIVCTADDSSVVRVWRSDSHGVF